MKTNPTTLLRRAALCSVAEKLLIANTIPGITHDLEALKDLDAKDIQTGKVVGVGNFGCVCEGNYKDKKVALKFFKDLSVDSLEQIKMECEAG